MNLNYEQAVSDVLAGKYGNGTARRTTLTNLGYDYPTIQTAINTKLKGGDWLSTLPQTTVASATVPSTSGYSGMKAPTISGALNLDRFKWNAPNQLGISYEPIQINKPLTYESGLTEPDTFTGVTDDAYSNLTGYGISNTVARAYAQNPRLGGITEKGMNLFNNTKTGIIDSGKNVSNAFGKMDSFQKIGTVANAIQGLWGAYNSYKNNKMIKDQINFQKNVYNTQYEAKRKEINSQLEDRQARRVAEQPHAHQSVADYMRKYGV